MIAISSVLNTDNIRLRSVCFLFAAFYVGFALYKLQKELLPLRIFLFYLIGYKKIYRIYNRYLYAPLF